MPGIIDVIDPCKERLQDLFIGIQADGRHISPGHHEFIDYNICRFSFNDAKAYESLTLEVYCKNHLNGTISIIKKAEVTFEESELNEKTINLSDYSCDPPWILPDPNNSYGERVDEWNESIGWANPLPAGDENPNFPERGDYDGDGISNYEEYRLHSSAIYPTVPLSLRKGINLYYFPKVDKKPNTVPSNIITIPIYYFDTNTAAWYFCNNGSSMICNFYDPNVNYWRVDTSNAHPHYGIMMKSHAFNALDVTSNGILYLDIKESISPILYIKGFSCPPHPNDPEDVYYPTEYIDSDLFYPLEFEPNIPMHVVLKKLNQVGYIGRQNERTDRYDSTYRFFGKSAGNNSKIKPYGVYIVHKKGNAR